MIWQSTVFPVIVFVQYPLNGLPRQFNMQSLMMEAMRFIPRSAAALAIVFMLGCASPPAAGQDARQQRPRRVNPAGEQQPEKPVEEVDEGDVVRVETQLVSVPAVVTNSSGRPITGLRAEFPVI